MVEIYASMRLFIVIFMLYLLIVCLLIVEFGVYLKIVLAYNTILCYTEQERQ